jgi:transcriptional regulator with XRE-family HTH domain
MRTQQELTAIDTASPEPRYTLKGNVVAAGFRTYREFAETVGVHPATLSQVLNGHLWPGPTLQKRMARELGLSLRQLKEML